MKKICSRCKKEKDISEFYLRKNGCPRCYCKKCELEISKEWRIKNKNKFQAYLERTKESRKQYKKEYDLENRDREYDNNYAKKYYKEHRIEILEKKKEDWENKERSPDQKLEATIRSKEYYINNKDEKLEYQKEYGIKNRDKIKIYSRQWAFNKYHNDINYKIRTNLSSRMSYALRHFKKSASTEQLIGRSFNSFKIYFESLFNDGMTHQDFMDGKIHIDHDIPCSAFDLSNPEEQKKCFHWTNLKPMWAEDNLHKSNKLNWKK